MHNEGGGHLPFGEQSNLVERAGGDRHLKPQLQNEKRPSKPAPLKGFSAGLLHTFLLQLSEGFPEHSVISGGVGRLPRGTGTDDERTRGASTSAAMEKSPIMVVVISLQNSDFNYDKHKN